MNRYRLVTVIAVLVGACSASVAAFADFGASDSPSGWFTIGSALAGGLASAGMFFGLLSGRLNLIEYRLTQIEHQRSNQSQ